ncbi:Hsp70 family protein [Actinoplanes regularis]|uniref:Hsp70 family protein n=1 Tax=Actinoplanes regularis TaxID=52697 RepID=UPI0024A33384|nr:Hsp70 family protein [Actinoplanes regularis]GLW35611.1 hypothetical protein Areg01_85460 [Actinoplanes regularis]
MSWWGLGVDLGTSFSAAAVVSGDRAEVLEIGRERRVPSTVVLDDTGRLVAGSLAHRLVARAPDRAERNPKRYVGRGPMLLGGHPVTAQDAMAALLELFVTEGRARFDDVHPASVVLTHPVAWDDERRSVLRAAARTVVPDAELRLVEEPVAAAVHYGTRPGPAGAGRLVAVYDLGGGTFDAAVLRSDRHGYEVLGKPGGDDDIGGEAFDSRVYAHFGRQLAETAPEWWAQVSGSHERRWLTAAESLLAEARLAKEMLSELEDTSHYIGDADTDVRVSRAELEEMVGTDIARTVEILRGTIQAAGDEAGQVAGVYLTGGASRMPLVQQALREHYPGQVHTFDDPKIVVALGAARLAARAGGPAAVAAPTAVPTAPATPEAILDNVVETRATASGLYAWCRPDGHRLHRVDPAELRPDRSIDIGEILSWTATDAGLLVADHTTGTQVHTFSPDLVIRATRPLPSRQRPTVVAAGTAGWVFLNAAATPADNRVGLPWGEFGAASYLTVDLSRGLVTDTEARYRLERSARWLLNEDNRQRRLIDQDSPSGSPPAPTGDEPSCLAIVGRFTSKAPLGASRNRPGGLLGGRHAGLKTWQEVVTIDAGGGITRTLRRDGDWLHQVQLWRGNWLMSTSAGLLAGDTPDTGRLLAARPGAGALRWFVAGAQAYAIGMEQVLPSRGLWIGVYRDGALHTLLAEPQTVLRGHLTSTYPQERPRVAIDGDGLLVACVRKPGSTQLLHVTATGVTELATTTGWAEPVVRVPSGLLCLHAALDPAGAAPAALPSLVRLT